MKKIYQVGSKDGYELCHPVNQDDFESINEKINGVPRGASWNPIQMRLIAEDEGRELLESDSPWLGSHALIFRARAIEVLGPLLRECGELLPLDCVGADVSLFNATSVVDALDEEKSSLTRFRDGRIMMVTRYFFRPDAIRSIDIFKIPNLRVSPTFVSERFVDLWNSARLRGLEFRSVWALG